MSQAAIEPDVG